MQTRITSRQMKAQTQGALGMTKANNACYREMHVKGWPFGVADVGVATNIGRCNALYDIAWSQNQGPHPRALTTIMRGGRAIDLSH